MPHHGFGLSSGRVSRNAMLWLIHAFTPLSRRYAGTHTEGVLNRILNDLRLQSKNQETTCPSEQYRKTLLVPRHLSTMLSVEHKHLSGEMVHARYQGTFADIVTVLRFAHVERGLWWPCSC